MTNQHLDLRPVLVALLLSIGSLVAFWPVFNAGFLNYDDDKYVTSNPHVITGISEANLVWAFTSFHASNWHPLTWLSHMTDAQLFGLSPAGHHFTNLAIHTINAILLFLLLNHGTGKPWRSAMVAALFALHPLHVESVAWVSERKDVLSTFFFLLTILSFSRYAKERPGRSLGKSACFYGLALAAFALGLMSKPMLVSLPFVLMLLDVWPLGRIRLDDWPSATRSLLKLIPEKIPFLILSAASCAVTFLAQNRGGAVMDAETLPLMDRLANVPVSYFRYLMKTVWPSDLAIFYPLKTWPALSSLLIAMLLLGWLGLITFFARRRPYLFTGSWFFFGTLVPVIGLVQVGLQSMADRYTYIPLIGIFVMFVWGLGDLAGHFRWRPGLVGISGVALAGILMSLTHLQAVRWASSETVFRHALEVTQDNFIAHQNLGLALTRAFRLKPAAAQFRQAVALRPGFPQAHNNLGLTIYGLGRVDEAIAEFGEALRLDPTLAQAHKNLGNAFMTKGDTELALTHFDQAIALKPGFVEAHYDLAAALATIGRLAESAEHYKAALALQPENPEALNNLAWLLASGPPTIRNGPEAVRLAQKASELAGNGEPLLLGTLAAAYAEAGQFEQAIATAERARELAERAGHKEIAEKNLELLQFYRNRKALPFSQGGS